MQEKQKEPEPLCELTVWVKHSECHQWSQPITGRAGWGLQEEQKDQSAYLTWRERDICQNVILLL